MTMLRSVRRLLIGAASGLTLCGLSALTLTQPSWGADKVTFRYGQFYRSVAVPDLVEYANTGKTTPELASFLRLIKGKDREQLTNTLKMKVPVDVATVDKLLMSPTGSAVLNEAASATIAPGDSGVVAMRGALLMAAASKQGLSTTSLIQAYPTPTLTVDIKRLVYLMKNGAALKNLGSMMGSFTK
jgi:Alpha/beta hydrolase of unknown function (DUF1400)